MTWVLFESPSGEDDEPVHVAAEMVVAVKDDKYMRKFHDGPCSNIYLFGNTRILVRGTPDEVLAVLNNV